MEDKAEVKELMLADISFRDHLAAEAMNGILSNHCMIDNVNEQSAAWVAKESYLMADAMLKARG
ncbi:hypothetical protein [Proteus genomosp. 6]|uniref:hypothetical protein n=1 Tax=Proteus genomosp. 6 TaxID=1311820 RepID=UPI0032DBD08E